MNSNINLINGMVIGKKIPQIKMQVFEILKVTTFKENFQVKKCQENFSLPNESFLFSLSITAVI